MKVRPLGLDGVLEIAPTQHEDERGFFSETYSRQSLSEYGVDIEFVQDNCSVSRKRGVLRGLHYQLPPFAQDKLVRVVSGRIFDVAVDIRPGSSTFAKWVGIELSRQRWNQLLVPKGFAHGFVTLEPETEVQYKVTAPYSRAHDRSIRFDDADIAIDWPVSPSLLILSEKDINAPMLRDVNLMEFRIG